MYLLSSESFVPLTPPVTIPGSSYFIQLGTVGSAYYVRVARGKTVIGMVPLHSFDLNEVTAMVYSTLKIPMFNMLSVMKAVGRMLNYFESNVEQKPVGGPVPIQQSEPQPSSKPQPEAISSEPPSTLDLPTESTETKSLEPIRFSDAIKASLKEETTTKAPPKEVPLSTTTREKPHLPYEEKWKRAVATINLLIGVISTYLRQQHGDNEVTDFWNFHDNVVANLWKKAGLSSFDAKIVKIVNWAEVLGLNFSAIDLRADSFYGEVKPCLLKERSEAVRDLGLDLPPDFPCNICWHQFAKITSTLGLEFKHNRDGEKCEFWISERKTKNTPLHL